jgi:hypothetical protein
MTALTPGCGSSWRSGRWASRRAGDGRAPLFGPRGLFLELPSPGSQLLDALWVYSALEQAATPLRLPHEVSRISHMEVPFYAGTIGWKMAVQGKRPALRKQQEAPAAPCEAPHGAPGAVDAQRQKSAHLLRMIAANGTLGERPTAARHGIGQAAWSVCGARRPVATSTNRQSIQPRQPARLCFR